MINIQDSFFQLETNNTSYLFQVMKSGHLEHLYYGDKIDIKEGLLPLIEKRNFLAGNLVAYSQEFSEIGMEDASLEVSTHGTGDVRELMIELCYENGSTTSDFQLLEAHILEEFPLTSLPAALGSSQCLKVTLKERNHPLLLDLIYTVFEECDVITRSAVLRNTGTESVSIQRFLSCQLDLPPNDYVLTHFSGAWAREMNKHEIKFDSGIIVNDSKTGTSSNRNNPFIMIQDHETTEDFGACYGFNLIYSGNHYEAVEKNSFAKTRILIGIQPNGFSYTLQPAECFETPQAVLSFSSKGQMGLSRNMHEFIRKHIVRGEWQWKERPILINSWEATYFDFTESKLMKLAKSAKEVGIELFVLDDGWFGNRNDDTSSLGDWNVNMKKLPNGLKGFADKLKKIDMQFGIWVEPEMVSSNSELYRKHPEWAVQIPNQRHSLGRNQMILDLTNPEVCEYIQNQMRDVFNSAAIVYVKWDMNRIFSDTYSNFLPKEKQGEFTHRYVLGLYSILGCLTKEFPHILFESCSAGGNRSDLGMLCYMPQIWGSDNTDPICRAKIQSGYSYGYPMSVIASHVSNSPNHQTLRVSSLETRFNIACFGLLGYECNIAQLSKGDRVKIKDQVAFYKRYRQVIQFGDYYRIKSDEKGDYQWMVVSKDKTIALALYLRKEAIPNSSYDRLKTKGLDETKTYHFTNRPFQFHVSEFGDLINDVSPIHIKQDSLIHHLIDRAMPMNGEVEDHVATGSLFNKAGVILMPSFASTGYDEETRFFPDFASRIYVFESTANSKAS